MSSAVRSRVGRLTSRSIPVRCPASFTPSSHALQGALQDGVVPVGGAKPGLSLLHFIVNNKGSHVYLFNYVYTVVLCSEMHRSFLEHLILIYHTST